MTELVTSVADKIDRAVQRVTPFAYRMRRTGRQWVRRALRKPRSVSEGPNLLPLLIQVLASFSKADGVDRKSTRLNSSHSSISYAVFSPCLHSFPTRRSSDLLVTSVADKIDRAVQRVTPFAYRMRRTGRQWVRRALRKPRSVSEGPNLLPLLIQVLASFSKADGVLLEEEIDSSLGFLRYDYPEAVYSELRQLFRQALYEQQDLTAMAQKLSVELGTDRKIMLGVQLYDLISQAGLKQEQVVQFYSFMSQLGMAAQAIDIVYQLNASEESDPGAYQRGSSPLESISFGNNGQSDVMLKSLGASDRLLAFRYHDLILLKNYTAQSVSVRSRPLARGGFCRIYPGQRILVGDQVLSYQELAQYFNAKKNVSLPQIFIRVNRDSDEVELERARSREAALEVTFGLKVRIKALRDVDAVLNNI